MGGLRRRIAVLTSSRADYGIYQPLLRELAKAEDLELHIIAFGTHLSHHHGYFIDEIRKDNYGIVHTLPGMTLADNEQAISSAFGLTVIQFASFWSVNEFDVVLCLGDRYEMCAAVIAGVPFRLRFAHLHGGETTLGAIDDIYRDQITIASTLHFTATEMFSERVRALKGSTEGVFTTGSISLDLIEQDVLTSREILSRRFGFIDEPYLLVTIHPVTRKDDVERERELQEMLTALVEIAKKEVLVVTMPNADMDGGRYRNGFKSLRQRMPDKVFLVENFGRDNYFAAMKHCIALIGNSSSGIIEAASFGKWVLNVGDRQKGRPTSNNVIHCRVNADEIVRKANDLAGSEPYIGGNIYYKGGAVSLILNEIRNALR